jgi:kynurenine formamidase
VKTVSPVSRNDIDRLADELSNWGRWGEDDEVGTLNYIGPADVARAASLVRKGLVFSLALPFAPGGPQSGRTAGYPRTGRFDPIHLMLRTGCDAYAGVSDKRGIQSADDVIVMPLQAGTQWDALSHVFFAGRMYNGYDCREVTSEGAFRCGIEKSAPRLVGRGVLIDIAAAYGVPHLEEGFPVTADILGHVVELQRVEVGRGDILLVRTGHLERYIERGDWDGFAGGNAPGLTVDTLAWLHRHQVAAVAADTWGVEVRPNETIGMVQPWHWVAIPKMGLAVGEIFQLGDLARDCGDDGVYEFMMVAPPLSVTGGVGAPVHPVAIK